MKKLFLVLATFLIAQIVNGQKRITIREAGKHIGDTVTILDKVSKMEISKKGATTFKLGERQMIHILIKAGDRHKFANTPEKRLVGKNIIVTGRLFLDAESPAIIVTDPKQLTEVISTDPRPNIKPFDLQ